MIEGKQSVEMERHDGLASSRGSTEHHRQQLHDQTRMSHATAEMDVQTANCNEIHLGIATYHNIKSV